MLGRKKVCRAPWQRFTPIQSDAPTAACAFTWDGHTGRAEERGLLIARMVGTTRQPLAQWSCVATPGTAPAGGSSGGTVTVGTSAAAGCQLGRGGRNDGPSQQR